MSRGGDGLRVVCSRVFGILFFSSCRVSCCHVHTGFRSAWKVEQSDGHGVYDVSFLRSILQIGSILLRVLARGTLGLLS